MRILGAIGLAILILVLQFLAPRIWVGLEETFVVFFDTTQDVLSAATDVLGELTVPH